MKSDVVVIGAGTSGLIAALKLAKSGLDVVLLEKNDEETFGNTWSNDMDLDSFDHYDLPKPLPGELAFPVHRNVRAKSSDDAAEIRIEGIANYALKMSFYQRRIAKMCAEAGVRVMFGVEGQEILSDGQAVTGVTAKGSNGDLLELKSRMLICACGASAPVLETMPDFCDFRITCRPDDFVQAIQEFWEIDVDAAKLHVKQGRLHENETVFYLGIPGGGAFSTFMYQLDLKQGIIALLAGCKPRNQGVLSPRQLIDDFKDNRLGFCTGRIYGGGRAIPVRYSLDSFVDNGIALVGESAFTTSPSNGSGTIPSMISAALCAGIVAKILSIGQAPTKHALWEYNAAYQRNLGATFAAYYATTRILGGMTESDIQKVIKLELIKPDDIKSIHEIQMIKIGVADGLKRFFRALPILGSLTGFIKHGLIIPRIARHYKNYPIQYDPEVFSTWRKKTKSLLAGLY